MNARLLLYLLRDTIHRWCKRLSSPLSRFLVALSLSFTGLVFLSSYALSIAVLENKIAAAGADLLVAAEYIDSGQTRAGDSRHLLTPRPHEYTLYIFHDLFISAKVGNVFYSLVEYSPELSKLLPPGRNTVYLLPDSPSPHSIPAEVEIEGYGFRAQQLPEKHAGFLRKLYAGGAIFVPNGHASFAGHGTLRRYVLRLHEADVEKIRRWENALKLISRLDKRNMNIISSCSMLEELEQLKAVQHRFRLGLALGCSLVICLLLTSISSMEFRQNEYVYALMGSFGISRFCLVLTFAAENTVLVFGGFGASLLTLSHLGQFMVDKLYGNSGHQFSLGILTEDIHIFLYSFIFCILASCLPIVAAILRPIGKILK